MIFELTVLGSSSALPTSTKFPTAHALNVHGRFFLIDCGEGTQIQLRKAKIKFSTINHIFISHIHGDHVFGLLGLLSSFNLLGRKYPLHIYGPQELELLLKFFTTHFAEELSFEIQFHPLTERKNQMVYEDKVLEVVAFPLKHRVPTFGYLFKEKKRLLNIRGDQIRKHALSINQIQSVKSGADIHLEDGTLLLNNELTEPAYRQRSFAYCSDTAVYKKNSALLKGVDLLYHEATFLDRDKKLAKATGHSTALQAAQMAQWSDAGQLLIGHFSNRYKGNEELLAEAQSVFSNTSVAGELMQFQVPLSRFNS